MISGFVFRLFARVFATSLAREGYAGILGRAPDAAGLRAHSRRLRRTGRLAPLLHEMAHSDEAREAVAQSLGVRNGGAPTRSGASAALDGERLVTAAYLALLERNPDRDESRRHQEQLARTGDLAGVIASVARAAAQEGRAPARRRPPDHAASGQAGAGLASPEALVTATFRGLLGRDPDAEAMTAYSAVLRDSGDLAAFIAEIGRSLEHRKRMLLRRQ